MAFCHFSSPLHKVLSSGLQTWFSRLPHIFFNSLLTAPCNWYKYTVEIQRWYDRFHSFKAKHHLDLYSCPGKQHEQNDIRVP